MQQGNSTGKVYVPSKFETVLRKILIRYILFQNNLKMALLYYT